MAFDPYDPCPCGSGKKFKWCCQPVYVQIDKAFQQDADGQHEAALKTMDEVSAEHGGNPEVWGRKAQLLYQLDRVEDAEAALQKAFDINPNYPFGYYLRGRFRHFEGEIPGALLLFRKAAEVYDPIARGVLAQVYSLITECELKLNRPIAARAALEMAAKQEPTVPDYKQGLQQVFGDESKLPLVARQEYSYWKLPTGTPAVRQIAWQTALQTAATGKLGDAAKAWETLTAQDESDVAAWYNLGLTRAWLGDNAAAVAALDRCVQLDSDGDRAAQTWALAEVLLCGHGMEQQANYVEHTATFPIRNPEQFVQVLHGLERERRLIAVQVRQEDGILTGLLVEKVQALTPEHAASQLPRLASYLMVMGDMIRLWNVNQETFEPMVQEMRQRAVGALGEPYLRTQPAHFADVLADGMAFPVQTTDEAEGRRRMQEHFERYMEEKWIHRPLRSLGGVPPVDAAGHGTLGKKLRGVVLFLEECAATIGSTYDFGRLRRKLGLGGAAATATTTTEAKAGPDVASMGVAELAALSVDSLGDADLELAHQAALKLDARDLAGKFARSLLARPVQAGKTDRYPLFNQLVQAALAEGNTDSALDLLKQGEQSDAAHNEGHRRNDYDLRRGQVHAKRGEADRAAEVFEQLIERAPAELKYRGTAAEAMLSMKQPGRALKFAEAGLKKSRELNNRDSEQYFQELAAAAKKQGS
jgi:tetratricopeptide (TPR) repeat protein